MDKPTLRELERARQQHIGRLLHRAARDFNVRALAKLHERGHHALSMAHTNLLPHLDVDGTRLTTLAERAGMTKQAAGQLVAELEKHGYVAREPDPNDGRALSISFTEAGWRFLQDAREIKGELEAEYRARLGEDAWQALQDALHKLLD